MRKVPESVKKLIKADYAETTDVVIIELPSTEQNPGGATIYLANRDGFSVDGQGYGNHLRNLGTIKYTIGQAPDTASFSIENVSLTFANLLRDSSNYIESATAKIYKAFKVSQDDWELVPLFEGQLNGLRFNENEIAVNVISKMSLKTSQMARRPITQRCIWKFKSKECGWIEGMGGTPRETDGNGDKVPIDLAAGCDRGWDTPRGCLAHGNIHRYGGVPQFTTYVGEAPSQNNGYDENGGGQWGTGPGGGWCVYPDSYVLIDFKGPVWKKARTLEAGDLIVSIDKFGKLVATPLVEAVTGHTTQVYKITTSSGYSLTCSPSHPLIESLEDMDGSPVSSKEIGDRTLGYALNTHSLEDNTIASIEIYPKETEVVMLELGEGLHRYIASDVKEGGLVSHNFKQVATKGFYDIDRLTNNFSRERFDDRMWFRDWIRTA